MLHYNIRAHIKTRVTFVEYSANLHEDSSGERTGVPKLINVVALLIQRRLRRPHGPRGGGATVGNLQSITRPHTHTYSIPLLPSLIRLMHVCPPVCLSVYLVTNRTVMSCRVECSPSSSLYLHSTTTGCFKSSFPPPQTI